jgi:hypothetical protein
MPQKFTDNKFRTDADIRPGHDEDARNKPSQSGDYSHGGGGATAYPGYGGVDAPLLHGGTTPANSSIRNIRVSEIPDYGSGELGSMELAGKVKSVPKIPPMQQFDSRPMKGPGPLEQQRLEQQQKNAIAMGDPDYAPQRELDYEAIKDANFASSGKSSKRTDKDFSR